MIETIRMAVILALFSGFSLAGGSARAQNLDFNTEPSAEEESVIARETYLKLPPDEQERLIEEATTVHNYCTGRELFAALHDCRCVAAKFLDERILRYDPTESIIGVADKVAKTCPNEPGIAGYAFTQCTKLYKRKMEFGLEEFCTCYAKAFTGLYIKNPNAHFSNLTALGTSSILKCSKEDIPNPLQEK